eukprot:scaffold30710_cov61-Phaeocystis_antarctica.AAC.10
MEDAKLLAARDLHTTRPKVNPNPNPNPNPDPNPNPNPNPNPSLNPNPDLHTTRPKVLATLLDCSVDARDGDASFESRLAALKEAMETRPDRRTLVLCSNPSTVDRIVSALGQTPSKNTAVRALHPDVAASERAATIAEFSADDEDSSPTARASASMVLVATDRA